MGENREQIIESAIALFNKNGIQGATISQIAKAVGISKGTLYYYFRTKSELLDTCFDYVKKNAIRITLNRIDYSLTPKDVIYDLVKHALTWPLEKPGEMEFLDKYISHHFNEEKSFNLFSFNLFDNEIGGERMSLVVKDCPLTLVNFLIGDILTSVVKFVRIYPQYQGDEKFLETISKMIWDMISK
ncbi:MAG: TetR/AcrR family transcriptional regulator [Eubacteriaceae bacterium]